MPFVGVDGEGSGVDDLGRQCYRLLRAGEDELYDGGRPLTTEDCLAFLTALPRDRIYVGYYFDYDTTQILRDLSQERRARLLRDDAHSGQEGISPYVDWKNYQIDYMPRKYLRVRTRGDADRDVPGITINDVGAFFQSTFVMALRDWKIGNPADLDTIAANKERRSDFTEISDREREYCRLECLLLAEMMEAFRAACIEAGYVPNQWQGAGFLSSAMLKKHKVVKRKDVYVSEDMHRMALAAYYGGRLEVTRVGAINQRVYEYDISSAYPAAMLLVPCLMHGYWRRSNAPAKSLYVADVSFAHVANVANSGELCNLPIRQKTGTICWPRRGRGTYWSMELDAATNFGTEILEYHEVWNYTPLCDCKPFDWLPDIFAERKRIGKSGKGKTLKLGMNGMYGKTAQSIGSAPWGHRIWAGIITAITRAWLINSYRHSASSILMLATDALYSTAPLDVDIGPGLGQWETKEHDGMFIVQPGLYWYGSGDKPKTRGIPQKRVLEHRGSFQDAWQSYLQHPLAGIPKVPIPMTAFIGLRLANARNKPDLAGCWLPVVKNVSFDWKTKRRLDTAQSFAESFMRTLPLRGPMTSIPYVPQHGHEMEMARMEVEAMPDYVVPVNLGDGG